MPKLNNFIILWVIQLPVLAHLTGHLEKIKLAPYLLPYNIIYSRELEIVNSHTKNTNRQKNQNHENSQWEFKNKSQSDQGRYEDERKAKKPKRN